MGPPKATLEIRMWVEVAHFDGDPTVQGEWNQEGRRAVFQSIIEIVAGECLAWCQRVHLKDGKLGHLSAGSVPTGQLLPQDLLISLHFLAVKEHGLSKLTTASKMLRDIQQIKVCDTQGVGFHWGCTLLGTIHRALAEIGGKAKQVWAGHCTDHWPLPVLSFSRP